MRTIRQYRSGAWAVLRACRWLPMLAMPFSMIFAETWFQLQVYQNGYASVQLVKEISELEKGIEELTARAAGLNAKRRSELLAEELGMVEPIHKQIEIVRVPVDPSASPDSPDVLLAQARARSTQSPGTTPPPSVMPVAPASAP